MNKVLVIVDMQNDFITSALPVDGGLEVVKKIKEKIFKEKPKQIFFTLDTHDENYLYTQEGKNLPVIHCIEGTKGWEIVDELKEFLQESNLPFDDGYLNVVEKNAFGSLALPRIIEESLLNGSEDIDTIELVGVCTDICVITNASILRTYFNDKIEISVDSTCCAGTTKENHDNALKVMKMFQIKINEGNKREPF